MENVKMKQIIKKIPGVNSIAGAIYRRWINYPKPFVGSKNYWIDRYDSGGNSGAGSYNNLAEFKAEKINEFVRKNNIKTIIEYGCGDGNQLKLAEYLSYIGFDVSPKALSMCKEEFMNDSTKIFKLMGNYLNETAQLTLSLDVIYHLIEDSIFTEYMNRLFDSSEQFVIIYASDTDVNPVGTAAHVKQRNFSKWVKGMKSEWKLIQHIPNRYPFNDNDKTGSFAEFFIYEKA
jgi:SAM-dependent methyltransferase